MGEKRISNRSRERGVSKGGGQHPRPEMVDPEKALSTPSTRKACAEKKRTKRGDRREKISEEGGSVGGGSIDSKR